MELPADDATKCDLPVNNESAESASDSTVVDESQEKLSQLVNGAADGVMSASSVDKTSDETRCKLHDVVKYEWTDITSDFIGACSTLELGELVHDSKFVASIEY